MGYGPPWHPTVKPCDLGTQNKSATTISKVKPEPGHLDPLVLQCHHNALLLSPLHTMPGHKLLLEIGQRTPDMVSKASHLGSTDHKR